MRIIRVLSVFGLLAAVSACGDTLEEQAIIGGGAGAVTALALDGNPLVGAVVGAAGNVVYCEYGPGKC
ncbi:hypothetical protein ACFORG_15455 [Lutimaribacter marinistellae]|uniref:17 kDa surface antigen n=1 Tax=Lutimaribacter marinistellae TaxID=1820329 RepID=A0ABV7TJE1_9RHOB